MFHQPAHAGRSPGFLARHRRDRRWTERTTSDIILAHLGAEHNAVNAGGDPSLGNYRTPAFHLPADVTFVRLESRRARLGLLDASPDGGHVKDHPLVPGDLLATIYHVLGINPDLALPDRQNRPVSLVPTGKPIHELF